MKSRFMIKGFVGSILVFLLCISSLTSIKASLASQSDYIVIKGSGEDTVTDAIVLEDGIVMIGSTDSIEFGALTQMYYISKVTFSGEVMWRTLSSCRFFDLVKNDMGFVVAGDQDFSMKIAQYSDEGILMWEKTQILEEPEGIWEVVEIDTSGNIIVGGHVLVWKEDKNGARFISKNKAAVAKIDKLGNVIWSNTFNINSTNQVTGVIVQNNTYQFRVRDEVYEVGPDQGKLRNYDVVFENTGSMLTPVLQQGDIAFATSGAYRLSNNQRVIMCGSVYTNNVADAVLAVSNDSSNSWLLKRFPAINENGISLIDVIEAEDSEFLGLFLTQSSDYLVDAQGNYDGLLCHINAQGDITNKVVLGASGDDRWIMVDQLDGNSIAVGYTRSYEFTGTKNEKADVIIYIEDGPMQLDVNAQVVESQFYEDINHLQEESIKAIDSLSELGILSGRGQKVFDPSYSINRAEFAKLLVLAFGLQEKDFTVSFTDVSETIWYYPYVQIAKQNGMINGYTDGSYKPLGIISKQEIIKICATYLKNNGIVGDLELLDLYQDRENIPSWVESYVAIAIAAKVLVPSEEVIFDGAKPMTREEAAVLVYRTMEAFGTK